MTLLNWHQFHKPSKIGKWCLAAACMPVSLQGNNAYLCPIRAANFLVMSKEQAPILRAAASSDRALLCSDVCATGSTDRALLCSGVCTTGTTLNSALGIGVPSTHKDFGAMHKQETRVKIQAYQVCVGLNIVVLLERSPQRVRDGQLRKNARQCQLLKKQQLRIRASPAGACARFASPLKVH